VDAAVTHIDLPVADVCAGAHFFRRVLAFPVHLHDGDHADVVLAPHLVGHLRRVPPHRATEAERQAGTLIELQVPSVREAVDEVRRRGATVLIDPVITEWDTISAFVAGPDDMVIELYAPCRAVGDDRPTGPPPRPVRHLGTVPAAHGAPAEETLQEEPAPR